MRFDTPRADTTNTQIREIKLSVSKRRAAIRKLRLLPTTCRQLAALLSQNFLSFQMLVPQRKADSSQKLHIFIHVAKGAAVEPEIRSDALIFDLMLSKNIGK